MSVRDTITRLDVQSWVRATRNGSQMLLGKEDIVPVSELIDKQDADLSALRSRVADLEGALRKIEAMANQGPGLSNHLARLSAIKSEILAIARAALPPKAPETCPGLADIIDVRCEGV